MVRGRRINVVYSDNGSGLSRDAWVVRDALERAGHRVWLTRRPPRRFPVALNYAPELAQQILRDGTQRVVKAWAKRTHLWDVNIFSIASFPTISSARASTASCPIRSGCRRKIARC